jgi:hypothetical protein
MDTGLNFSKTTLISRQTNNPHVQTKSNRPFHRVNFPHRKSNHKASRVGPSRPPAYKPPPPPIPSTQAESPPPATTESTSNVPNYKPRPPPARPPPPPPQTVTTETTPDTPLTTSQPEGNPLEAKKKMVVSEMVETERRYVQDIAFIIEVFSRREFLLKII